MNTSRTIAVVTGSRAEYGLLRPVMSAIAREPALQLRVIVTGSHLLPPAHTMSEVAREFEIDAAIPMQDGSTTDRAAEALALGRGVEGFARRFAAEAIDIVLVLGDRIEAFAAAAAACAAGIRVAHMHGGDRAEGIADESLRHAITKLAHIHLPATEISAHRIIAMGEAPERVHVVGSPAIDELHSVPPLADREFDELGRPDIVFLLHPIGRWPEQERADAGIMLEIARAAGRVLALDPNHDAGRSGIVEAIQASGCQHRAHLPREQFIGLLRRAKVLLGNSSAGLIEAAALGVRTITVGQRQRGRERAGNAVWLARWDERRLRAALAEALAAPPLGEIPHPFGDGRTGERTASLLASIDLQAHSLRKQNTY